MVEATSMPSLFKMASFYNASCHQVSGKDKEENAELIGSEVESLQSILTELEVQVIKPSQVLSNEDIKKHQIAQVLHFSIAPSFTGRIFAMDNV